LEPWQDAGQHRTGAAVPSSGSARSSADGAHSSALQCSRTRTSYRIGWLAIACNVVLFAGKLWVGALTGSIAIMADAWHTLSDSLTSIFMLIGAWVSARPRDDEHPFGHGRAELVAALAIGVFLGLVALNLVMSAVERLALGEAGRYAQLAVIVIGISVVAKEILARISLRAARRIGSQSMRADGRHHRADAATSAVVLVGVFLSEHVWWIDGVLAIVISGLLLYSTYEILRDAINPMLGQVPDTRMLKRLSTVANRTAGYDVGVHHVHMHKYGHHREVTMHITLPANLSVAEAHRIATSIEQQMRRQIAIEPTIHVDPSPRPEPDEDVPEDGAEPPREEAR